ncbi:MAG: hypothetical protein DI597_19400 [Pseudoxanthomonas spadix]|nr:MAG: hypothetical protein DI597_19400 [Pseudoxanthomonas spadix]
MAKTDFPSQGLDKYVVRFPEGMRERIAEAAKANNRSMNAEIIGRLEASFLDEQRGAEALAAVQAHNEEFRQRLSAVERKLGIPPEAENGLPPPEIVEADALIQRDKALLREMNELQAERDSPGLPKAKKDAIQAELTRIHAERKGVHDQMRELLGRIGGVGDSEPSPGHSGNGDGATAGKAPKRKR